LALSVWVNGECTALAFQQGDSFGLLMDIADMDGSGVLPPFGDEEE
jgi:hypothetical protein